MATRAKRDGKETGKTGASAVKRGAASLGHPGEKRTLPVQVLQVLIVMIAVFLAYSNTFHSPFVFDDEDNIVMNPVIRELSSFFGETRTQNLMMDPSYVNILRDALRFRYIGYLTFALNYKLNALDVTGYHIFNLAVHMTNALLVYGLVLLTLKRRADVSAAGKEGLNDSLTAFFAALIFAVHPIQTQAVTYIVQRFASLATLFFLLSLVLYIKARTSESTAGRAGLFATSVMSAIFAMKTKEIAFTLPLMVSLYEFLFFRERPGKRALYLTPFLLTMAVIPFSLLWDKGRLRDLGALSEATNKAVDISRLDYLLTQFRVIVTYLRLMLFPAGQNLDYDYPVYHSFFTPPVFLSFAFLALIVCGALFMLYRSFRTDDRYAFPLRVISFGILWFFVTLSVESSLVPILDVIFEHRLYLPSMGFILASVAAVSTAGSPSQERLVSAAPPNNMAAGVGKALFCILGLVACLYLYAAYERNKVWSDEESFWADIAKKSPNKARGHSNLGATLVKKGRLEEALGAFQAAIRLEPSNSKVRDNLGIIYDRLGRFDDAIREYHVSLKHDPDNPKAHNNLGTSYSNVNKLDDAIMEYKKAIELNPFFEDPYYNLGVVYTRLIRLKEARASFQKALTINPNHVNAHNNLGAIYEKENRLDEAIREFRIALEKQPDYISARCNLGLAYYKKGLFSDAKRELEAVLKADPGNPLAASLMNAIKTKSGKG